MDLNGLLEKEGFDPREIIVLRHRPTEPKLRKILPWLAAERPDLFNTYQQTHGEKIEKAFLSAKYAATFIGHAPGKALFVGLYEIGQTTELSFEQYWKKPAHIELKEYGMRGFGQSRPSLLWFDMPITTFYEKWKGKMVVRWPPPERSWWRRAHRNTIDIEAVLEQSILTPDIPPSSELVLDWDEIGVMPTAWRSAIAQWRGVYYIFDKSDAKGYIGSASGSENIYGRWMNYASTGHGGNNLLRDRDPKNFCFSVLELVSPNLPVEDVYRIEAAWKLRLHTRSPIGLNDN